MSTDIHSCKGQIVLISIVIPTYNRSQLLAKALDSISQQSMECDKYEVLVVDNGSTDDTAAVVKVKSQLLSNLKYYYEAEPGLHAGRHRGLKEAKGDILVYIDDDIEATTNWLKSIQQAFLDPEVVLVGGNNLPLFIEPPPKWLEVMWKNSRIKGGRALPSHSLLELKGESRDISPYWVWGCNFSIRKDVLIAAGGFHPDSMPKDRIRFRGDGETHVSRFIEQTGQRCFFHSEATVYHKVTPERMTQKYFYKRGFSQGVSESFTRLRNKSDDKKNSYQSNLLGALRRSMRQLKQLLVLDSDIKLAHAAFSEGHAEGVKFHKKAYHANNDVREWVHKSNYFLESK
jgi:glucosyl-dolichyl phosphate glucuronosyltransferase